MILGLDNVNVVRKWTLRYKGSAKSGNRGHAGRPGKRGGSAPKSSGGIAIGDVVSHKRMTGDIKILSLDIETGEKNRHQGIFLDGPNVGKTVFFLPEFLVGSGSTPSKPRPKAEIQSVRVDDEKRIDEHWSAVASGSGGTLVYHGTSVEVADAIRKDGLQAFSGDRLGHGEGRPDSVYFTTDRLGAVAYGEGASTDFNRFAVIEFSIPKAADRSVIWDEVDFNMFGQLNDFRIERNVPSNWIKSIVIHDMGGNVLESRGTKEVLSDSLYATIFIRNSRKKSLSVRYKGSATSGNYGHGGRPGKRGGSAPKSGGTVSGLQHTIELPKNKRKLTIPLAAGALEQMGYTFLGKGKFDLSTQTTSYEVELAGTVTRMTADTIKELVYAGSALGSKSLIVRYRFK